MLDLDENFKTPGRDLEERWSLDRAPDIGCSSGQDMEEMRTLKRVPDVGF